MPGILSLRAENVLGCAYRSLQSFGSLEIMFAVVKSGGKQYRVNEGQELVVDRLRGEVGDSLELPVGFVADDKGVELGGERTARVEILEHLRGDKLHIYKYKPKKGYRKKTGHRQELTRIRVLEVSNGS
jgi:large subunit ribosomal protein L21